MAELSAAAAPFKESLKPLCNGAFGCPKETDVAAAMDAGQIEMVRGDAGDPKKITATAFYSTLKRDSKHNDFAKNQTTLSRGNIYVRSIAALPGRADDLGAVLDRLLNTGQTIWVACNQEYKELANILNDRGFRPACYKISAGSDVIALYAGFGGGFIPTALERIKELPAEELASLAILTKDYASEDELKTIRDEISAHVAGAWASHYSSYNKRDSWKAVALKGYDKNDPTFIVKPEEMSRQWKIDNAARLTARSERTKLWEQMPTLARIVDRIPGEKDRVRLMRLAPGGGELARHADITDRSAGVADGCLTRLHVPIITEPAVQFTVWDLNGDPAQRHMPTASLCYLDQRKPHACTNGGKSERIHLVMDVHAGSEVREWITGAYQREAEI